jgi:hypothetical protein
MGYTDTEMTSILMETGLLEINHRVLDAGRIAQEGHADGGYQGKPTADEVQ